MSIELFPVGKPMKAIQLELDFQSAIAQALAEPEVADLRQICGRFGDH